MNNNTDKELYNKLSKNVQKQIEKLDELDIYTSKHIHSVPQLVNKMCQKMNCTEKEIKFFVQCAYLHDIGKIFIPPEILQKKGKLTDDEYKIMKTHTTQGAELCESLISLKKYSNVARSHHENEDGSGYPNGINNIPIEAAIIKVADVYDALVSKRQYKEEIKIIKAIDILKESLIDKGLANKIVFKALLDVIIENESINEEEKEYINSIRSKII